MRTRLIPAHAGKTRLAGEGLPFHGAHPRACGENLNNTDLSSTDAGSSPRMRGKHSLVVKPVASAGLIPAHAGKTLSPRSSLLASPAHPRACGENYTSTMGTLSSEGSSPRMRGKQRRTRMDRVHSGLIPAHAGKTMECKDISDSGGLIPAHAGKTGVGVGLVVVGVAHPRACGENEIHASEASIPSGSSPRMRGKHVMCVPSPSSRGLIPAHAGKTGPST